MAFLLHPFPQYRSSYDRNVHTCGFVELRAKNPEVVKQATANNSATRNIRRSICDKYYSFALRYSQGQSKLSLLSIVVLLHSTEEIYNLHAMNVRYLVCRHQ